VSQGFNSSLPQPHDHEHSTIPTSTPSTLPAALTTLTLTLYTSPSGSTPSDPAGAFKRLLLEDVLFLASRRKPKFDRLVLSDPETHELIDSQFERGLHNIFMYYCKISDRRRGADASHATKVKSQQAGPTAQVALTSRRSSVLIAAGKYHTSFSEFVSFIRDFKIVGGQGRQALLTVSGE